MLSSEVDALGMHRVKVIWKLADQVKHTFDRMFRMMGDELTSQGIAQVKLDPPLVERDWPNTLVGTWHHMGTTRMHDSPNHGVVDRNCQVHGMSNLYVAGSSVFPTAGANFPTMTLVALAHRLADRLSLELTVPRARASSSDGRMAA
jgi:choline dehydrogenase-like flavoprotein